MDAQTIGNQFKGILDDSASRLKVLEDKGIKVAGEVAAQAKAALGHDALAKGQEALAKGQKAIAKGQKAVQDLLGEIRPQDLLERYGKHTIPELVDKVRASELTRHTETIRSEILGFLKLPQADQVDRLESAVGKLNKDVAALKSVKADVKKLADQVKAVQMAAKAAPKAK